MAFSEEMCIDDFLLKNQNKNTLRKTIHDVRILQEYLQQKNENVDFEFLQHQELNDILCNFFICVKKPNMEDYEPNSLRSMFASFKRYLDSKNYEHCIVSSPYFQKTRRCLTAKQKSLKSDGKGNLPKATRAITDDEIDIFYSKRQFGIHNPMAIINTLWWNNCKHFGMRGCREHHDLRWGDIIMKKNVAGKEYLEYSCERQTKTRQGDTPLNIRSIKPTMWSISEDMDDNRNPVAIYKHYRDRRPESMLSPESPFYLGVNHVRHCSSTDENFISSKSWFKAQPLGINMLNSLMKVMSKNVGIEGNVSNHSARKTMIQKLKNNNIPDTDIIQVSGHKNIQSLNSYSKLSENRQEIISDILNDVPVKTQIQSTSQVETVTESYSNSAQLPIQLFAGASVFGGNINIKINNMNSPKASNKRRRIAVIDSDSD